MTRFAVAVFTYSEAAVFCLHEKSFVDWGYRTWSPRVPLGFVHAWTSLFAVRRNRPETLISGTAGDTVTDHGNRWYVTATAVPSSE